MILNRLDERSKLDNLYKWIFIAWSPCHVSNKHRTVYALSKSSLMRKFTGGHIKTMVFASDINELSLEAYLAFQSAPAPLNEHEKKIIDLEENEQLARSEKLEQNGDLPEKYRYMPSLPIDSLALTQLDAFKKEKCTYLRFFIDIQNEKILIEKVITCFNVNLIQNEMPLDKARFHLFRFNHYVNSKQFKTIIFVYSIPDQVKNVKERMIYSSCKGELLNHFKVNTGIEITKAFEVSELGNFTREFILESIHHLSKSKTDTSAASSASDSPVQSSTASSSTSSTPIPGVEEGNKLNESFSENNNSNTNNNNLILSSNESLATVLQKPLSDQPIQYVLAFGFVLISVALAFFKLIISRLF